MIVVLPMAGRGSRFADRGYDIPKPLIEVAGKPMFYWALQSLKGLPISRLIIISLQEHEEHFHLSALLKQYCNLPVPIEFVFLPNVTEGQLCTVMAAEQYLEHEQNLLIAASDTFIVGNLLQDIELQPTACAGVISVIELLGDRWSFARTDNQGKVIEVAEKNRISDHASTGLYYFSSCKLFRKYAQLILENQEKTKGEYYIIPVYQKMIDDGHWVGISQASEMWDMGTPEAKAAFEQDFKQS